MEVVEAEVEVSHQYSPRVTHTTTKNYTQDILSPG
jgi:hypothetical protein